MTIHQIECFLEAARTLNFTEAANHLYISQQGLSRQIASCLLYTSDAADE